VAVSISEEGEGSPALNGAVVFVEDARESPRDRPLSRAEREGKIGPKRAVDSEAVTRKVSHVPDL
jgi:hypothetical protein